jgi:hypothetical protein
MKMASAKLIKALEKGGFRLEFPGYESIEEEIIEILKEGNERISISLPLLLKLDFDYKKICHNINSKEKKEFNKIILIANKIYQKEKIPSKLKDVIKKNNIKESFASEEFERFYDVFKESELNIEKEGQKIIEKQSKLRLNLDLNKSLKTLFSPAKIRIMEKIFNHEKLTNTELKYYYRAISNIDKSVLNPALQDYLRIIEITKKHTS